MPALIPTEYEAEVIWLGVVTNDERAELRADVLEVAELGFAGLAGSVHGGLTRASCSRVLSQYPRGTEIRNERQLSIVSEEELAQIASQMGVAEVDPVRLGASMVLRGIPDFSHVPPSSRLQAPSGATVVVDMENHPCVFPGKSIEAVEPGKGKLFKPAAKGRRGVTAWVAREGRVALGDRMRLHVPAQRGWQPAML